MRLGALPETRYRVVLNSDDLRYGGSGAGTYGEVESHPLGAQGWPGAVVVTLPPLGLLVLEEVYPEPAAETAPAAEALPSGAEAAPAAGERPAPPKRPRARKA